MSAPLLAALLRDPARAATLPADAWPGILSVARAEALTATLAHRLVDVDLPGAVAERLAEARAEAAHGAVEALWEGLEVAAACAGATPRVVLLKGTAYVAAGLPIAAGRQVGDCDILVARADLGAVEDALTAAGWATMKADPYDQRYYRRWMHELPPMLHAERARMVDVHHTILPLTHRARPDAAALLAAAEPVPGQAGLYVLSPPDRLVHAAAHCLADGALEGGLRNLWDIAGMLASTAAAGPAGWSSLADRARLHGLAPVVARAARLAHALYGAPLPPGTSARLSGVERWLLRGVLARDDWGRPTRGLTRAALAVRGHWLRMPPPLLARHLMAKAAMRLAAGKGAGPMAKAAP